LGWVIFVSLSTTIASETSSSSSATHPVGHQIPLADDMDVEDMIRPMFAWMDKLHTNTLDFAVLLEFFQIVGWEPLDRRQIYVEWREDRL
jgi:hypothetical protein